MAFFAGALLALSSLPGQGFAADGNPVPGLTPPAMAAPASPPAPTSIPLPAPTGTSPNATPNPPMGTPMASSISPPAAVNFPIAPPPGAVDLSNGKNDKGLDGLQTKVPDSVKEVIKRLDNTNVITLDDLNSARQAIARIDALIDIEKHISELQKIRQERDEGGMKSSKAFAAAIPASAIAPPPPIFPSPPPQMNREIPPPVTFSGAQPDVVRISGSDGRYSALLKTADNQTKTFLVGDRLPTGGTVEKITASEVVVNQDGAKKILHVKNVDMVFSDTP